MPFTKQILNPLNQCKLTGLEKKLYDHRQSVKTFEDCQGRIRIIFSHCFTDRPDRPISGLFLQKLATQDYQILGVYTVEDERNRGFAQSLLQIAKVRFRKVRHSENLTVSGKGWMNKVEGLNNGNN